MKLAFTQQSVEKIVPDTSIKEYRDARLKGFLLRVTPNGSKSYYCELGRGQRIFVGRADALGLSEAREAARTYLADHFKGDDPRIKRAANAPLPTLGEFLSGPYAVWAKANQKAHTKNLDRLETAFRCFLSKRLDQLKAIDLETWKAEAIQRGLSPETVRRDVASLKAAYNRAVDWELIAVSPITKVKRPKTDLNPKVRFLSDDEEANLRAALDDREERMRVERDSANEWRRSRGYPLLPDLRQLPYCDHMKPMVLLSLNTGMRRGEVFDLTWEHIDLTNRMITVPAWATKSSQTRHIPMNKETLRCLANWKEMSGADQKLIFENHLGDRFGQIKTAWSGLLKLAGIKEFRWHDLRHHFASKLVVSGVDLNTVRELLGHSDYKMTLRYAHLAPQHKRRAVEVLDQE
jgi:integrase